MYKMADMQGGDSDYRWRGLEQEVGLVLVSDLAISPLILQCVFNYRLQVSCAEATLRNGSVADLHNVYDLHG